MSKGPMLATWNVFTRPRVERQGAGIFLARGHRDSLFLTADGATLKFSQSVLRRHFEGARAGAKLSGESALPGKINYLVGNDPARWPRSNGGLD
jgi:hypothetical protein